jgi:hypothetical protein
MTLDYRARLTTGPQFPPPERLRLVVSGAPNTGKSTFVASIPALHIDPECGADFVLRPNGKRFTPDSPEDLEEFLTWLKQVGPNGVGFKHVVIDTVERWRASVCRYLVNDFNEKSKKRQIIYVSEIGEHGAGHGRANDRIAMHLHDLFDAGFGWTVTSQLVSDLIDDPSNRGQQMLNTKNVVSPGVRNTLFQEAQFCCRIIPGDSADQYILQLATVTTRSSSPINVLVKARLIPFFRDEYGNCDINITGPRGWDRFVERYNSALAKAKASLVTNSESSNNKEQESDDTTG